ncbi:lipopolysaccharide export LptBFGC system permease protein LptF [Epilithonimonas hungarica]|uniref:hypothetical protein n=1 Tax=Epilithonimonas hungarica TaxID=454006 RepID=UPI00278AD8A7|nr:hypothetical protein [Epilithonimonas hungarica]MDP9955730.1 lipopolysaccharide export LptBFGC system permease protein LptF [Epilithonimonas hungarica]
MKLLIFVNLIFFSVCFSQKKQSRFAVINSDDYSLEYDKKYFTETDGIGNSFLLFINDSNKNYIEFLRISSEDLGNYEKMDLEYFSEIREYALKEEYKILNKNKDSLNGNEYIDFIYEKETSTGNFKSLERLFFYKSKIHKLLFNSSKRDFEKHLPKVIEVLNSFKFK